MISIVQPLPAGNAIRLFIAPPAGAKYWRVLKAAADLFSGPEDLTYCVVAYEGDERVVVDIDGLQNETPVFYRPYYRMHDDSWTQGATVSGTPAASYEDQFADVQSLVRERIEAGLKVECQRQNFLPEIGYVQVYTAPPAMEQSLRFPLVTISVDNESPEVRSIGEEIAGDEWDAVGEDWFDSEGWLASVRLSITGWTENSDERVELRKALRRILIANLPVMSSRGIEQVSFDMQDVDLVNGEFAAPLYQVGVSFSCLAPVRVGRGYGDGEIVRDIVVDAAPDPTQPSPGVEKYEGTVGMSDRWWRYVNYHLSGDVQIQG